MSIRNETNFIDTVDYITRTIEEITANNSKYSSESNEIMNSVCNYASSVNIGGIFQDLMRFVTKK